MRLSGEGLVPWKIDGSDDAARATGATDDEGRVEMPKARTSKRQEDWSDPQCKVQRVSHEHAGKWIAWSEDGHRIVAVGSSFRACEKAAAHSGFAPDQVAIERVPETRERLTGSGM